MVVMVAQPCECTELNVTELYNRVKTENLFISLQFEKKQQINSRGNQSNGYLWEREMDGGTEETSGVWESSIFDLQVIIRA